jgi:predicted signal transduction protein with EAL and GGDEF domain
VLLEVARRLTATVRDADTVARMGGDEFVVLCEGTGEQAAVLLSCELEQAVRAPIAVADDEVRVTTSVGLVVHDPGAEAAVRAGIDLVRSADAAMYRAKEGGKDRHTVYDAGMQTEAELRNRTADVVREALLDQRLVVHYQPIVDLVTGRATGVEALCRVLAADGSLLMPAEFIGVAEDRGLIVPLGQQVLDVSCRQVVAWQSEGLAHLDMSVNVAAQQAAEEDFADVVAEVLARTGCPPDRLVLELTESTLLTAAPRTLSSLHRLRELGIGIAIDDFGTRYASLHYVQHFPITELKIDRSFVAGLPHQRTERAIVGAVASLARELDLVCVAEGIETTDQQAHLAGLGVRGQGYALGRPTPAEQCAELLRRTLPPAGRAGG